MLQEYRQHVEQRAAEGLPPLPLTAQQVSALVELLKWQTSWTSYVRSCRCRARHLAEACPLSRVRTSLTRSWLSAARNGDTPTVDAWCDLVGMAPATLHSRCARAGVRAKTALDLGRLLRVVSQKPRDQQAVERLLENRDIRSIRALLARSGLRASDLVLLDRTTLLRSQTLTDNQSLISDLIRAISSLDD